MLQVYGKYKSAAKLGAEVVIPMGLCYVAAALEQAGHRVNLIDADAEGLSQDGIIQRIKEEPFDVVGVTATTPVYSSAKQIIESVKEYNKEILTILGGAHLTVLPAAVMEDCPVDIGVIREGEETVVALLNAVEKGLSLRDVKGIIYREGEIVITNEPRPWLENLDSLPFPARHLLKEKYIWSVPGEGLLPVTTMLTQRGCPFDCVFCSAGIVSGRKVRYRSVNNVVDEIEQIVAQFGIRYFFLADDTLTLDKKHISELCTEIKKRDLKVGWDGTTRANIISKELLSEMKSAGLKRISFGIESGSQRILNAVNKGTTLEELKQAYQWCNELGLETRGSVMVGNPFETKETIKQTSDFIRSLKCYQVYINIAMPYPGSELYEMAKNGVGGLKLLTDDWREYRRYGNSVMEMNGLTVKDLISAQRKMYLRFYLRPRIIFYNLRRAGLKAAIINIWAFVRSVFLTH
ncbi:B12-binding domain-containing radical SAM protein [Chloroflexota bacterium]